MALKDLAKMLAAANATKTPAQEFLFMLNEAIMRMNDVRKPSMTFKPSSLGGCTRMVYFQVVGAPLDEGIKAEPELIGMGESGTDRHLRIQTAISKMQALGYPVEWVDVAEYLEAHPQPGTRVVEKSGLETKLANSIFNMSFLCDGIIRFNNQYYVLEIKTETSMKWAGRVAPAPKAVVQALCYAATLGIDKVMYIYENRDTLKKKTFIYEVTQGEIEDKVIAVIETVNDHIKESTVPPMTTETAECRYCNYQTECRKWGS